MPKGIGWNRPDEPGLASPDIFSDPTTYLTGGIGGLLSKLAGRGAGAASQPALSAVSKIANLRRAVRRGDPFDTGAYNPSLMKGNWEKVQKALERMKGGE